MQAEGTVGDGAWSSAGLSRTEAINQWCHWASRTLTPIDVRVSEPDSFVAEWRRRDFGPLQFVEMSASAQYVTHPDHLFAGRGAETFQLVYSRRGTFMTRAGRKQFAVRPGEFVLLDNSRFYQMDMDEFHRAIDLVMPQSWLERWLPDPSSVLNRPLSAREGWGAPLGSLLDAAAGNLEGAALPRPLISDQIGSLLSLLTGVRETVAARHRTRLARRIFHIIERHYHDPEMTLDVAARELGISKRYIHALLAEHGTSFVQALNGARLEHAADLLRDPRHASLQIGEIALRSGFFDAGYFTRLFRRRFGLSPRSWRARHLPN